MPFNSPTPQSQVSPVASPEFPSVDFSNIGRMPKMNFGNPNTTLIMERGTNPRSSMANFGPFAAMITDASGRVGTVAPSRGELLMKALRNTLTRLKIRSQPLKSQSAKPALQEW